jgi:transcriptional regulator with XRE-family HTH domain
LVAHRAKILHAGGVAAAAKAPALAEVIAGNIAAERARQRLSQASVAARMNQLGFPWIRQTVGDCESGRRQVSAPELLGLAHALTLSVGDLIVPPRGEFVTMPFGQRVGVPVTIDDEGVLLLWVDDELVTRPDGTLGTVADLPDEDPAHA